LPIAFSVILTSRKVTEDDMKIARIAQITLSHYDVVYKLEVDYVLDSGEPFNCVHGEPDMTNLVKDVISISGECTYSQVFLVNL
jgi:hypothetical protein